MNLVFGSDVYNWVVERLPSEGEYGEGQAIGFERDGRIVAGAIFTNFRGCDVEMSLAAESHYWAKPEVWSVLFDYTYNQLGCDRVTLFIAKKNKRARRLAEHVGFTLEGIHPRALTGGATACSYGMINERCRWIHG